METSPKSEKPRPCFPCGFRYVVMAMCFLMFLSAYMTRFSFSVALIAMVNNTQLSAKVNESQSSACKNFDSLEFQNQTNWWEADNENIANNRLGEKFDWDLKTQSYVLSAIFYGSMVSQMPGGMLIQRFGIRWVFGMTSLVCAAINLVIPAVAGYGAVTVIVLRFIQGILQGGLNAVAARTVALWADSSEKSKAFAIILSGLQIGVVLGMAISGILADSSFFGGWPSIFYLLGCVGCVFSLLWLIIVTDAPEEHWCVSSSELKRVQEGRQAKQSEAPAIPWRKILTSMPVWTYILAIIGRAIQYFFLMIELPIYLNQALHFNIKSSGVMSAVPTIVQCIVGVAAGYISDALHQKKIFSPTTIRKLMNGIACFAGAAMFIGIAYSGCRTNLIVVLLILSCGAEGFAISGSVVSAIDLSPVFTATLAGISNTFGLLSGALVPYIVAEITSTGPTVENWQNVFIVFAVVISAIAVHYSLFGTAERQPWDSPQPSTKAVTAKNAMDSKQAEEVTRF